MNQIAKKKEAGFTFVEIIVVIVILGIIAAIAVPKFISVTEDANQVAADATYASMKSAASMAFAKHRAAQLEKSGKNDEQYVTDAKSLEYFIDEGFPKNVSGSGKTVTLQDGSKVTITAETNEEPARLERK